MEMTEMTLRLAEVGDAEAIADLHVAVWRQTYGDLAPAEAIATLNEAFRFEKWKAMLSAPKPDQHVLLAEKGNMLVGIGAAGAPSDEAFGGRGEIKFLYIASDLKRQGLGRKLMKMLAIHLRDRQYPGAALSVVEGNQAAADFYTALGAKVIGGYIDPGPIWRSQNIIMGWDSLEQLIY